MPDDHLVKVSCISGSIVASCTSPGRHETHDCRSKVHTGGDQFGSSSSSAQAERIRDGKTSEIAPTLSDVGKASRFGDPTLNGSSRCTVFEVVLQSQETTACPQCVRSPRRARLPACRCAPKSPQGALLTSYLHFQMLEVASLRVDAFVAALCSRACSVLASVQSRPFEMDFILWRGVLSHDPKRRGMPMVFQAMSPLSATVSQQSQYERSGHNQAKLDPVTLQPG